MNMKGFYRVNRPKVLVLLFTVSILLVVVPVTATNALQESPHIIISPNSGSAGTTVQVEGYGFLGNGMVSFEGYFVANFTAQAVALGSGDPNFVTYFDVPTSVVGIYTVEAQSSIMETYMKEVPESYCNEDVPPICGIRTKTVPETVIVHFSASTPFTVLPPELTPVIVLSPNSGSFGTTVQVEGYGFLGEGVVSFEGHSVAGFTAQAVAPGSGDPNFVTYFDVPTSVAGIYTVEAQSRIFETITREVVETLCNEDDTICERRTKTVNEKVSIMHSASAPFTVLPTIIVLSPSSGPVGITVQVEGYNGFLGEGVVSFEGQTAPVASFTAQAVAHGSGDPNFVTYFDVPTTVGGIYTVEAQSTIVSVRNMYVWERL